jgi:hypothetical protein
MLEELQRFAPEIAEATVAAVANAKKDLGFLVLDHDSFAKAPKTSIDYAVMERTDRAVVLTADVGWSDVGESSAVWRLSPRDADGNSLRGRAMVIDSSNVLVRSEGQLAAVVGLKDVVVVATGDAVLVADRSQTAKVKKLVESLKAQGHPEATEHWRNYRPWGYYQSIDQGSRYQVKRIVVRPGGRLSLQKHHHRAEHLVRRIGSRSRGKAPFGRPNRRLRRSLVCGCPGRLSDRRTLPPYCRLILLQALFSFSAPRVPVTTNSEEHVLGVRPRYNGFSVDFGRFLTKRVDELRAKPQRRMIWPSGVPLRRPASSSSLKTVGVQASVCAKIRGQLKIVKVLN